MLLRSTSQSDWDYYLSYKIDCSSWRGTEVRQAKDNMTKTMRRKRFETKRKSLGSEILRLRSPLKTYPWQSKISGRRCSKTATRFLWTSDGLWTMRKSSGSRSNNANSSRINLTPVLKSWWETRTCDLNMESYYKATTCPCLLLRFCRISRYCQKRNVFLEPCSFKDRK